MVDVTRAIVLAAGKGERLAGITKEIPKPMIEIKSKPILEYNIEWLKKNNINEIYINLHHLPDMIKNYFGNGNKWGVKITYSYEPELLGTAGGVKKMARELFVSSYQLSDEAFLVLYGDNFYDYNLKELMDFHLKRGGIATIGLYRKEGDLSQSGVVVLNEDGLVVRFIEKPKGGKTGSNLVNTGMYILEPEILSFIPDGFSDFGKDIFPELIKSRMPVYGYIMQGVLIPVDTVELYQAAINTNFGGKL